MKLERNTQPALLIVDAQSVKDTNTAALKSYSTVKKALGIKCHIGVDTQSLPHGIAVTTAKAVTSRKSTLQALGRCKASLVPGHTQNSAIAGCHKRAAPGRFEDECKPSNGL